MLCEKITSAIDRGGYRLRKEKKNRLFLILFIVGAIVSVISITTVNSTKNKYSDTIVFLGNKNIAPIVYEKNGVAEGIAVDLVESFEDKIEYNVEVQAIDWLEAQDEVLIGEADGLLQMNPSRDREELYDFSDEFLESEFSIFTDSANTSIYSAKDLIDRTVGIETGGYICQLLKEYDGIQIVDIVSASDGIQKINTGELDAIVVDRWLGEYALAQSRLRNIRIVDQPVERHYSRIAVKKGNDELLQAINKGLREIKADGTMSDIINDWQGKKVMYVTEERMIRSALLLSIGVIVIIFLIGLYFVNKYRTLSKQLKLDVAERNKELRLTNELLAAANSELEKMSLTDKLTNIYNRRYFDRTFNREWLIAKRNGLSLALIMLDIDEFKHYNDTYGHLAGDKCLENIANQIDSLVKRRSEFVARYGGEELAVVLPNTTIEGAHVLAEKIRNEVEYHTHRYDGRETKVTVSLGVASMIPNDSLTPKDLIAAADKALYQAKESGRNRVVSFGEMKE